MFGFQCAATILLGADIALYSDGYWTTITSAPAGHRDCPCEPARPDRPARTAGASGLTSQIAVLRGEGGADRFTTDDRYRWVLHRLWIAAGNEAPTWTQATGQPVRADRTWANLYDLRNHLAHS
jgi:hypothetical protein